MRHMKHLLTTIAVLLYSLVASAQTKVEIDGIWYNLITKAKQAEVTYKGDSPWDYYEYSGSITLPATVTYDGVNYSVTSIGDETFYWCHSLTTITLPESVTSIGDYAFAGCSSLTAITLPENSQLTSIGYHAFGFCPSLTTITIPENVTSIGNGAFCDCSSLTAITIPESVTSIGNSAFEGCSKLTAITIPENSQLTSIGERAFCGCSSLTAITIPEGVTSIGSYAFCDCSSLTAITIPESVTSIGEYAFSYCSSLTAVHISDIAAWCNIKFSNSTSNPLYYAHNLYLNGELLTQLTIPEAVTSIGSYAFYGCSSLTAINIPEGVTSIGSYAFSGCSSLTAITLPEGVTSIGSGAFNGCSSLTAINIPESVTSIGYAAFSGCRSLTTIVLPKSVKYIYSEVFAGCAELTDVYCHAEKVPSTYADAFDGSYIEYATLHVPASALGAYRTTAPWSSFGTIVSLTDEKVTSITLNHTEATLTEGQTLTLIATVEPGYATDRTVTWSSTDFDVAAVDNNGKVTAIALGTATIIAKASDGSGVSASCEVIVEAVTEVAITINQYGSGTYCSPYALDFSNVEGLKAYAATGYNNITGVVTLTRVMTAQPGEGLFIKGEPGKYMVPVMESTGDHTINMLKGTLTKTAVNKTSDDGQYRNFRYTTKTGVPTPMFYEIADGYTLSANKAYLQIPTAWLPAEAKSISLRFDEGEGTTDIDASTLNAQRSTEVYDLQGRRVDNPLKGGIYIVGGKKVIVK